MTSVLLLLALVPGQDQDQSKKESPAPQVKERRTDRVLEWNGQALEAIRKDRTAPPLAARNLAILHAAVADAVNVIYQTHKPYLVNLRATDVIDPHVTVAVTAHRVLVALHPRQRDRLDRVLQASLDAEPASTSKSRAVTLGRYVADRVLAARRDDLKERTTTYRPSEEVGLWRPTPPGLQAALLPSWGETRPFGVKTTSAFRPTAPPELTSKEYADDFNEVKDLGSRHSRKRTAEQSIIAWFWNDGAGTCTPPGHWNQIAAESSLEKGLTQPENARLFALLNLALADAAITCWDCKYRYRLWRPVTAIREADRDGNDDTARDARWESLLPTPPFPSYTSGHSTFSGAAATVLAKFFGGDEFEFTLGSDGFRGTRRAFRSFSEAADEAGRSRIYGGIHYECDNREGLALGKAVAEEICRTRLTLENAPPRQDEKKPGKKLEVRRERP